MATLNNPKDTPALSNQVATLHELYGRLHENIEQFQRGSISTDDYSRRHAFLTDKISEVRAKGIDLVASGLDPTIGSSNPQPVAPLPPQLETTIRKMLDSSILDWNRPSQLDTINADENYNKLIPAILALLTSEIEKAETAARIDELKELMMCDIADEVKDGIYLIYIKARIATLNQKGQL